MEDPCCCCSGGILYISSSDDLDWCCAWPNKQQRSWMWLCLTIQISVETTLSLSISVDTWLLGKAQRLCPSSKLSESEVKTKSGIKVLESADRGDWH